MDRDEDRLAAILEAWPGGVPLVVDARRPSWQDDATFELLGRHGAALCASDLDDADPPDLRVTGPLLYLRLRRSAYPPEAVAAWAARLEPFLAAGLDGYVFLRHDDDGTSTETATALAAAVAARLGRQDA